MKKLLKNIEGSFCPLVAGVTKVDHEHRNKRDQERTNGHQDSRAQHDQQQVL